MNKFWHILEYIQNKMKIVGAACLMAMVFLTCINVVGRFFNYPIFGTEEIVGFLAAFVIAMSLPYAHKEDAHIGVEILVRLFTAKTRSIIKLITNILSFILFIFATWRIAVYAYTMRQTGEVSMNLQLPEYYVIYMLSLCFLIFSLFILKDILNFF
ncbi:MAG: TRAP transporter small permease [Deltaproteobacteria bacterium]|nr:TRAP transporter small permease [Deltaproteobacteria bacterium]